MVLSSSPPKPSEFPVPQEAIEVHGDAISHVTCATGIPSPVPPSTPSTVSTSYSSARRMWWHESIVRRTLSFVENDLEKVHRQSPFLQQQARRGPSAPVALFHRSEILTGRLLGKGGFSEVYEIIGFSLNHSLSEGLTREQQDLRRHMAENCIHLDTGTGRFAIKRLQERLLSNAKDFQFAASDLAVEASYLSALDHPHILPLRGLPLDGLQALADGKHDSYFIITDRLVDTLDRRVKEWGTEVANSTSSTRRTLATENQYEMKANYALQLASALEYLHERRIVFRDLKPHNIGFTLDDQLQLFDFGLCRELPAEETSLDGTFEMSAVGTRRYMAVEIINDNCYNCKADVYSWAMVFWEMLSLGRPYPTYSVEDHRTHVCQGGERPPLPSSWPQRLQRLLTESWMASVRDRLTMSEVCHDLQLYLDERRLARQRLYLPRLDVAESVPDSPVSVARVLVDFPSSTHMMMDSFSNTVSKFQNMWAPAPLLLPDFCCHHPEIDDLFSEASEVASSLDASLLLGDDSVHSWDNMEIGLSEHELLELPPVPEPRPLFPRATV